jgi:uncharacterized protein YkwD
VSLRAAHRTAVRFFATTVVALLASVTAVTFTPGTALASSSSMESQFIAKMNAARQSAGLRPYSVASDLTSVARGHSNQMAQRQQLYHNPSLTSDVQNWQAVGENVGEGPTVDDIHQAFMNSPEHRDNILDHDFTQVGVGVTVDSHGTVWVTEDFRQPMHSTSPAPRHTTSSHPTATHHTTSTRQVSHAASHPAAVVHHAAKKAAAHHVVHPAVAPSPQARLFARLTALRSAAAQAQTADPVAAAFDYLANVTSLTSAT